MAGSLPLGRRYPDRQNAYRTGYHCGVGDESSVDSGYSSRRSAVGPTSTTGTERYRFIVGLLFGGNGFGQVSPLRGRTGSSFDNLKGTVLAGERSSHPSCSCTSQVQEPRLTLHTMQII